MTKRFIGVIVGALAAASFLAADVEHPAPAIPQEKIAAIETGIAGLMARRRIPGLSIAVVVDGRLAWSEGYGWADVENAIPAEPTTAFRIASVSKAITAVAVMQLAERGALDLDAPVQRYVPTFPEKPWPVTLRQLLGHLGGIRNYRADDFGGQPDNADPYASLTDALAVFKDDPLDQEPGTRYSYTTFGYTLLGAALEGASGSGFAAYMREHVFEPAGMGQTRIDSPYDLIARRARGYTLLGVREKWAGRPPTGPLRNCDFLDASYKLPGGGLVSTAEDLARFAVALGSGVLVRRETFEAMSTRQRTRSGEDTPYGLGWYVEGIEGHTGVVWHGGVQKGVTSTLYLVPRDHFAVAILTNLEGGLYLGLEALAGRIGDIVTRPPPPSNPPGPS
jgi:CubicO group peptidase (beta-lactamase class C family)